MDVILVVNNRSNRRTMQIRGGVVVSFVDDDGGGVMSGCCEESEKVSQLRDGEKRKLRGRHVEVDAVVAVDLRVRVDVEVG